MLPEDIAPSDDKFQAHLDANPPHVVWQIKGTPAQRPIIQSVHCEDGVLCVTVHAPEL